MTTDKKAEGLKFSTAELTAQIALGPARLRQFAEKLRRYVKTPPNKADRPMFKVRLKQIEIALAAFDGGEP